MIRKCAAEFIGSAFLLTIIIGSGIMGESLALGNDGIALFINSIATGCGLVVLIGIFAPISGAHFNPIVTLYVAFQKHISWRVALLLIAAQFLGGFIGVITTHLMFDSEIWQISTQPRMSNGRFISEIIASFGLLMVIVGSTLHCKERVALHVGLYISSAYFFTASTSFANPAVTFARIWSESFAGIAPASAPFFMIAQCFGLALALLLLPRLFTSD